MSKNLMVAALTVVVSGGIVWGGAAVPAAATDVGVHEPKGNDRSRRVCRRIQPTGSRLAERICRTQAEWDETAQQARDGQDQSFREDTIQNCREQGAGGGCEPR